MGIFSYWFSWTYKIKQSKKLTNTPPPQSTSTTASEGASWAWRQSASQSRRAARHRPLHRLRYRRRGERWQHRHWLQMPQRRRWLPQVRFRNCKYRVTILVLCWLVLYNIMSTNTSVIPEMSPCSLSDGSCGCHFVIPATVLEKFRFQRVSL